MYAFCICAFPWILVTYIHDSGTWLSLLVTIVLCSLCLVHSSCLIKFTRWVEFSSNLDAFFGTSCRKVQMRHLCCQSGPPKCLHRKVTLSKHTLRASISEVKAFIAVWQYCISVLSSPDSMTCWIRIPSTVPHPVGCSLADTATALWTEVDTAWTPAFWVIFIHASHSSTIIFSHLMIHFTQASSAYRFPLRLEKELHHLSSSLACLCFLEQ